MTQEIADLVARAGDELPLFDWHGQRSDIPEELIATVRAQQEEIGRLREALIMMVDHEIDYMTINNLGDPGKQHRIKVARAALSQETNP